MVRRPTPHLLRLIHDSYPEHSRRRGFCAFDHRCDPGKLLYKWVHSVHHKSYNPGPWSGLAMHPVEHALYFTRAFVCLFIPLHPIHMVRQGQSRSSERRGPAA